jgi:hypothetical protein
MSDAATWRSSVLVDYYRVTPHWQLIAAFGRSVAQCATDR